MKKSKSEQIRLDHLNQHSRPVSRRDFLSLGMIGFSGMVLMPSLGLSSSLPGDITATSQALSGFAPFLVFDLAGGASLSGNFLVGKKGGPEDLLTSYSTLGWNPKTQGYDSRFGLPMAKPEVSKILEGILQTTSPEAQSKLRLSSLLHFAQDDSSVNQISALPLLSKIGVQGNIFRQTLGMLPSISGGNSRGVISDASLAAINVNSVETLDVSTLLGQRLKQTNLSSRRQWSELVTKMALHQVNVLSTSDRAGVMSAMKNSFEGIGQELGSTVPTDSRKDSIFQKIYNINTSSSALQRDVIISSIVMNVLNGVSGPGAITIGGCDYHDGTQQTGDTKDLEIGREIGRAIESAHQLKKPLFLQILTDGGIYSDEGSRVWRGDAAVKSMSIMGYYHPAAAPKYIDESRIQIGSYTDGQGVDTSTLLGDSPMLAGYIACANYLSICGKLDENYDVFRALFQREKLDSVLVWES